MTQIQLSPDGDWVAYTVTDPRRAHMPGAPGDQVSFSSTGVWNEAIGTELRITHIATGETRRLNGNDVNAWGPSWSPDGRYLAFYSDASGQVEVWVWEPRTGESRVLTREIARPAWTWETARWTPDARYVLTKLLPRGVTLEEANRLALKESTDRPRAEGEPTARVFGLDDHTAPPSESAWPTWYRWSYGADLAAIAVDGGDVRRLVTGEIPTWWEVSPDGRWLAYLHSVAWEPDGFGKVLALTVVPVEGGPGVRLAGEIHQAWGVEASWSPCEPRLAWTSGGAENGLFVASAPDWEPRRLTELRPGWSQPYEGPRWRHDGTALHPVSGEVLWTVPIDGEPSRAVSLPGWSIAEIVSRRSRVACADDPTLVLRAVDPERRVHGFFRVDPSDQSVQQIAEDRGTYYWFFTTDISLDGETVVLQYATAEDPPDLWLAEADMRRVRRLTSLNPQFEDFRLGTTQLLEWETDDGRHLAATLLLPPGHREGIRVPLIVEVYGGRFGSRQLDGFHATRQLFATRGYAVLVPDIPVAVGTPMQDIGAAVLPALDAAIESGVADADRLGVWGHSYGGYSVLALLVQTDRFRAAAASASQGNLFGMHSQLDPDGDIFMASVVERGQGRMGGTPWEQRARYIANSPYFFLDRVTTPLLLLHGAEDRNTSVHLAEQIYVGLRRLGSSVAFIRYEGEDHWWGRYRPENRVDYWERVLHWFHDHLR